MADLADSRVLAIASNLGVEQNTMKLPLEYLYAMGSFIGIAAPELGPVHTLDSEDAEGQCFTADQTLEEVSEHDYDLLLLPGGLLNADLLRTNLFAQRIVNVFAAEHKPIAAAGHAPSLLVNSRLVNGKSLTSSPSIRADLENAGGSWRAEPVVTCTALDWPLVTTCGPEEAGHFIKAIDTVLARQLNTSR